MNARQTPDPRPAEKAPDVVKRRKTPDPHDAADAALAGDDLPESERIEHQNDFA